MGNLPSALAPLPPLPPRTSRSRTAPSSLPLLTVAGAGLLPRSPPGALPWRALGTVASPAIQAVPVPAWLRKAWSAMDRPAERVYANVVTMVTGGWLTTATALGPATTPMLVLAAGLALICALPWWASHRRRARVRVDRMLESWPEIATAIGLAGSQVTSATVDVWGWRARFRLARGQTIRDVIAKVPAIEPGLGPFRGPLAVHPLPAILRDRVEP